MENIEAAIVTFGVVVAAVLVALYIAETIKLNVSGA